MHRRRTDAPPPSQQNGGSHPPHHESERRRTKRLIRERRHELEGSDKVREKKRFTLIYHLNLIIRLSSILLSHLVLGTWTWVYMLGRLFLFVIFLLPGFMVMGFYYLRGPIHNLSYFEEGVTVGKQSSRHLLDIYMPMKKKVGVEEGVGEDGSGGEEEKEESKAPVIVFLTGGAWIIGYKMWGALLSRALCPHGVLVVIPDYRNFPQTGVEGMMGDLDMAVQWVRNNIEEYGGDPDNVVLVGQSAGAHLGSMLLLTKAAACARSDALNTVNNFSFENLVGMGEDFDLAIERNVSEDSVGEVGGGDDNRVGGNIVRRNGSHWRPTDLRGWIPISGPYDLVGLSDHFQSRGLDRRIINWIFDNNLSKYSPTQLARNLKESSVNLENYFPPVCLIHGSNDVSVPCSGGVEFGESLLGLKIDCETLVYSDMTHTDPILEKPFAGDQQLHRDIYERMRGWCEGGMEKLQEFDDQMPACVRVAPQVCIDVARACNPF